LGGAVVRDIGDYFKEQLKRGTFEGSMQDVCMRQGQIVASKVGISSRKRDDSFREALRKPFFKAYKGSQQFVNQINKLLNLVLLLLLHAHTHTHATLADDLLFHGL
jgi:hypothetical protein